MSSEKDNNQEITRSKQSRRKALKSMVAGSGAVIAGKSLPEEWAKPMVDSVLLPAHAQTSPPSPPSLACSVSGNVQGTFTVSDTITNGTYPFPGTYNEYGVDVGIITVTPQLSVTSGITDAFNLTVVASTATAGSQLNQNVVPSSNGVLAFDPIATSDPGIGDEHNFVMTLTPDNASICGGPEVIDITFNAFPPP